MLLKDWLANTSENTMKEYKKNFIEFMIKSNVLTFGDFVTKSGRETPYFVNTGNYENGAQISKLSEFYCQSILNDFGEDFEFDMVFGPAYKGIPLCVSIAQTLSDKHGKSVSFTFNRKEAKDHGEGGSLVGYQPKDGDKVLIVEDVTTSGKSIRETAPVLLKSADVDIVGLVISVDRMEKGTTEKGALRELQEQFSLQATSIVNVKEVISYLHNREIDGKVVIDDDRKNKMEDYLAQYGVQ